MNDFNQIHDLYHHGTKGQKWGLRRALWYPISAFKKSQTAARHPLKPKADEPKSSEKSKSQSASSGLNLSSSGSTRSQTNTASAQENKSTGQQPAPNQETGKSKSNSDFRITPTAPTREFSKSEKKLRDKILADNDISNAYKNKGLFSTQELTDILTRSKAEQDVEDFIKKNKSANAKAQAFLKNTNLYTANAAALLKNSETIYKSGKTLKEAYDLYKKMSGSKTSTVEKKAENMANAAETVAKAAGVTLPAVRDA